MRTFLPAKLFSHNHLLKHLPTLIGVLLLLDMGLALIPHSPLFPEKTQALLLAVTLTTAFALTLWLAATASSQRKLLETARDAALAHGAGMLESAQRIARLGSFDFDPDTRRILISESGRRLLGLGDNVRYTINDIDTLIHPDDRAAFTETWRDALKGEEFDIGHRVMINGKLLWLHTRAELTFDSTGKLRGFIGVFQDVTTQHHAATHLAELLDFSEKIVAESPVGIAVLDADGPCVLANEAFARMLGTTAANIRAINFRALPTWRNSGLFDAIVTTLRNGQPMRHTAHGETGFGRIAALEIDLAHIARQERPHVLLIAKDISEFEAAATALREASRLADEANQAKSEFLANMSHEIRTPMNAIIGLAQLALDHTADSRLRDYLTQMYSSANLLLHIINDILDYSKIEAGRLSIDQQEFALRDITARTIGMFRQSAGSKGLTLNTEIAPDVPPRIFGDPVRIGQIVINLVANAVKFTESGEVKLSVRRAPDITSSEPDTSHATLEFVVSDTGIGMDWMALQRLFEPFVQADGSITRQYGGTGLGLTISRRLARLMGGDIRVQSQPQMGSQFVLQLRVGVPAQGRTEELVVAPAVGVLPLEPSDRNITALTQPALPITGDRSSLVERDTNTGLPGTELLTILSSSVVHRLVDLQQRLNTNDFITVGELAELRQTLTPAVGARAQRLEAAISRYDYAQARAILAELIHSATSNSVNS